jgi:hypothetical protein
VLLSSPNVRPFVLAVHRLLLYVSCTNTEEKEETLAECILLLLRCISTSREVGTSFFMSYPVIFMKCEDTACACLRVCACKGVCVMSLQKHLRWNNIMILLILLLPNCLAPGSYIDSHAGGFSLFSSSSLKSCLMLNCLAVH